MTTHTRQYVFISYSRKDVKLAQRIVSSLSNAGVAYWIDEQQLDAGDSLLDRIGSAISSATFFIVLLSANSINSKWVQEELKFAMTQQLQSTAKFIIPVLIGSCEMPWFLQDRVYIDFSNGRRFKTATARLIQAIDDRTTVEAAGVEGNTSASPKELVVDQLASNEGLAQDEWFKEVRDLPILQQCVKAIQNGAFGGEFRRLIRIGLAFASNQSGAIKINNLTALMFFLADISDTAKTRLDIPMLIRELLEDRAISQEYRWFLLSFITKTARTITDRADRLSALPQIFSKIGRDPLANRLLVEFFEGESDSLADLWNISSAKYRQNILDYAIRIGNWSALPKFTEETLLKDSSRVALANASTKWLGIKALENDETSIKPLLMALASAVQVGHIPQIVDNLELLSSLIEGRDFGDIIDTLLSSQILSIHGQKFFFDLHIQLLSSPYISAEAALICLISLVITSGIDNLYYSEIFPTCLLCGRDNDTANKMSILDCLVHKLALDANNRLTLDILVWLAQTFNYPPFLAAMFMAIKNIDSPNETLKALGLAIQGKRTYKNLRGSRDKKRKSDAAKA